MGNIKCAVGRFTGKSYVKQNSSACISRLRASAKPMKAYTDNLIGCLATVFYVEQPHVTHAQLAHFAPSRNKEHGQHLKSFLHERHMGEIPLSKVHLVITVPGDYEDPESQEIRYPEPFYPDLVSKLYLLICKELENTVEKNGTQFSWHCVPYGNIPPIGKSYYYANVSVCLDQVPICTISSLNMHKKIEL